MESRCAIDDHRAYTYIHIFQGLRPTAGQGPNMRGGGREGKGKVVRVGLVVVGVVVVEATLARLCVIPSWGLCWPILGAMLAHVGLPFGYVRPS